MNTHQDESASSRANDLMFHERVPNNVNDSVDMTVLCSLEQAQADEEPDLIVELIDLYLEHTPRQLATMSAQLAKRDSLALRRAAHSLKGSSATMGAGRTAQICEAVERLVHDCSLEAVAEALDELQQEFAHVRESFLIERLRRTGVWSA